jgi:hypothetical protein
VSTSRKGFKGANYLCLELTRVRWAGSLGQLNNECGTLLEIWPLGGVLHTDGPIPEGTLLKIHAAGEEIEGRVQSYENDRFGYYHQLTMDKPWFPVRYRPTYLLSCRTTTHLRNAQSSAAIS